MVQEELGPHQGGRHRLQPPVHGHSVRVVLARGSVTASVCWSPVALANDLKNKTTQAAWIIVYRGVLLPRIFLHLGVYIRVHAY